MVIAGEHRQDRSGDQEIDERGEHLPVPDPVLAVAGFSRAALRLDAQADHDGGHEQGLAVQLALPVVAVELRHDDVVAVVL